MSVVRSCLLLAGCLGTAGPATLAQASLSGSETNVDIARDIVSGGGAAASTSFSGEVAIGNSVWAHGASSASFAATGGVLGAETPLGGGLPVVFQTVPANGSKNGSDPVSVLGFNFAAPGSGATSVLFDGAAASAVSVATNTRIDVTTPAGVDGFGNPLAGVPVDVINQLGSAIVDDAFLYRPALVQDRPVCVGGDLELTLFTSELGSFGFLIFGIQIPFFSVQIPGFDGSLLLLQNFIVLSELDPAPFGTVDYVFTLPDDPMLAGVIIPLQSVSLDAFVPDVTGAFTNVIEVVVQS